MRGPLACSPEGHDDAPSELATRLERDTGTPWALYVDGPGKAVRFLAPREPVAVSEASPELTARAFLERYRGALFGGDADDELRALPDNDATPDAEDGAYVRFEHVLRGTEVRVFDVASTARFTKEGALMWVQSGFRAGLRDVPRTASFAEPDARRVADETFAARCGDVILRDAGDSVSTLGVSLEGGAWRLVWRVRVMRETDRCTTPTVAIDATNGAVLAVRDEAQTLYEKESSALNESFSDVMGAAAENALEVNDPGRNFVIGEQITKSGRGIRNMRDPIGFGGGDLDHYSKVTPCSVPSGTNDLCGVHTNSGIPNLAFALMTAGGVHPQSRIAVAKGIDWPAARQLWFYTLTRLSPDADFKTAALAQGTEAKNRGFDVMHAVACAWYAVGVLAPELHPALAGLACPAPGASSSVAPSAHDCQGRSSGWFCSNSIKNTAVQCAGRAVVHSAFCADTEQSCKKARVDDWTTTVTPAGEVACE